MTERRRRFAATCMTATVLVLLMPTASSSARADDQGVRTVQTTPNTPETTEPETTEPETTEPETSEPETTQPGAAQADDDADLTAVTIGGLIAFTLLIALAGWWMVQRRDDDDAPHPRPPNLDEPLPGQDLL